MIKSLFTYMLPKCGQVCMDHGKTEKICKLLFFGMSEISPIKLDDYSNLEEFLADVKEKDSVNDFFWEWMQEEGFSQIQKIVEIDVDRISLSVDEIYEEIRRLNKIFDYGIYSLGNYLRSGMMDAMIDGIAEVVKMLYAEVSTFSGKCDEGRRVAALKTVEKMHKENTTFEISSSDMTGNFFRRRFVNAVI